MPHTTRPPILDITEEIPGPAAYARTAVRLHPWRGNPGVADSHIEGPLLWPAAEPWPLCREPHGTRRAPPVLWRYGAVRSRTAPASC